LTPEEADQLSAASARKDSKAVLKILEQDIHKRVTNPKVQQQQEPNEPNRALEAIGLIDNRSNCYTDPPRKQMYSRYNAQAAGY
jgi:hypothetical protein